MDETSKISWEGQNFSRGNRKKLILNGEEFSFIDEKNIIHQRSAQLMNKIFIVRTKKKNR